MSKENHMGYQDQVAAAAAALKRGEDANWELARLTYENTREPGSGSIPQPGRVIAASLHARSLIRLSGRPCHVKPSGKGQRVAGSAGPPDVESVDGSRPWRGLRPAAHCSTRPPGRVIPSRGWRSGPPNQSRKDTR